VEFSLFCLTHFCLVPYDCAQLKLLSEIWGPLYREDICPSLLKIRA
jgi:hypothetical protein